MQLQVKMAFKLCSAVLTCIYSNTHSHTHTQAHTRFMALLDLVRDYLGEPAPGT